jgi:hypothetical protein
MLHACSSASLCLCEPDFQHVRHDSNEIQGGQNLELLQLKARIMHREETKFYTVLDIYK